MPFHQLQAEQIRMFRDAWTAAGHEREPRVSVSRSIFPLVNDLDRAYFGRGAGARTRSATSTAGRARLRQDVRRRARRARQELAEDEAIAAADTLLLTVPNQLGVDYNAHAIESILSTSRRSSAGASPVTPRVWTVEPGDVARLRPRLGELLIDSVEHGASVGFLVPLSAEEADSYWGRIEREGR